MGPVPTKHREEFRKLLISSIPVTAKITEMGERENNEMKEDRIRKFIRYVDDSLRIWKAEEEELDRK